MEVESTGGGEMPTVKVMANATEMGVKRRDEESLNPKCSIKIKQNLGQKILRRNILALWDSTVF